MKGKHCTWLVLLSFLLFCGAMGGILATLTKLIGGSVLK